MVKWRGGRSRTSSFVLASRPGLPVEGITFLHLATLYNLAGYVRSKIARRLPKYNTTARSLPEVRNATSPTEYRPREGTTRITDTLLELGADHDPKKRERGWRKNLIFGEAKSSGGRNR